MIIRLSEYIYIEKKGCKTQFMFSIEDMEVRDTQVL